MQDCGGIGHATGGHYSLYALRFSLAGLCKQWFEEALNPAQFFSLEEIAAGGFEESSEHRRLRKLIVQRAQGIF